MAKINNGDIIDGEKVIEVLYEFKILRHEWEMDGYGWIVSLEDQPNKIILSDHDRKYIASWDDLDDLVKIYRETIQNMNNALFFL